jgi:hypothetical protein
MAGARPRYADRRDEGVDMTSTRIEDRHGVDDYWLEHCEGFRVDSPNGRIGLVAQVLPASETLVVLAGRLGTHTLLVPFDEVVRVRAHEQRIDLERSPQLHPRHSWLHRAAA